MDTRAIINDIDFRSFASFFFRKNSIFGQLILDLDGIIVWCNKKMEEIYETKRETLIGKKLGYKLEYRNGETAKKRIEQAIKNKISEPAIIIIKTKQKKKYSIGQLYRMENHKNETVALYGLLFENTNEIQRIKEHETTLKVITQFHENIVKERELNIIKRIEMQCKLICPNNKHQPCPAISNIKNTIDTNKPLNFEALTYHEQRIARFVKVGHSIKECAENLNLSERTIINHRMNIRKKLNLTGTPFSLQKYLAAFEI